MDEVKRSAAITFRCDAMTARLLRQLAAHEGVSLSKYLDGVVSEIVTRWVAERR